MHNRIVHSSARGLLSLLMLILAGCATPQPPKSAILHLQLTDAGRISWGNQLFAADQLPARLAGAHVDKAQNIRIQVPDNYDKRQMAQIFNLLRNSGYPHVLFQEKPRATAEAIGDPESRTELLIPNDPKPTAHTP